MYWTPQADLFKDCRQCHARVPNVRCHREPQRLSHKKLSNEGRCCASLVWCRDVRKALRGPRYNRSFECWNASKSKSCKRYLTSYSFEPSRHVRQSDGDSESSWALNSHSSVPSLVRTGSSDVANELFPSPHTQFLATCTLALHITRMSSLGD